MLRLILWVIMLFTTSCNLLHLIVLLQMKLFRRKPMGLLVIAITLADITSEVFISFRSSVAHPWLVYTNYSRVSVFIVSNLDCGPLVRYYILAAASIEKYLAICHPFKYENHVFIRHIKLWCLMAWAIPILLVVIRDILFFDSIQFNEILGAHNLAKGEILALLNFAMALPFSTAIFCQIKILLEIRRMRQLPTVKASEDRVITSASKYLIIITGVLLTCLLPPVIIFVLMVLSVFTYDMNTLMLILAMLTASYGFVNVLAFAILSTSYQQKVTEICTRYFCLHRRVGVRISSLT